LIESQGGDFKGAASEPLVLWTAADKDSPGGD
jgi:hypothetical protein